jgi:hypothetical protein
MTSVITRSTVAATEDGSLARQRLTQMRDFSNFLFEEIPALLTAGISDRGRPRRSPPSLGLVGYLESS